ncbi:MAG: glutathione binding-like protein [Kofleriaceae bacterium]|nr:glutathione binding-like protein [Kofleriaceae bacterium]
MPFTLYFSPGACSLALAIALHEANIPFERVRVNLRDKTLPDGSSYLVISPKGYVPTLRLHDDQLLTEASVTLQYIGDQRPDAQLIPPYGTFERYRAQELLNFIATELHKGMNPFYNPAANEELKASLEKKLADRWAVLAEMLRGRPFLRGGKFTVADAYAFYALRAWQHAVKRDLAAWPALVEYYGRLATRPSVIRALEEEGLKA